MHSIGERFLFHNSRTSNCYCTITQVDSSQDSIIYHIAISTVDNDGDECHILHAPFSKEAFEKSINIKISQGNYPDDEHLEAIDVWQKANGGVWNIDIYDMIDITFNTSSQ